MTAQPIEVRIMCNVTDKAAFEEALATFMDSQGLLLNGYIFSVRKVDMPVVPVVHMDREMQP